MLARSFERALTRQAIEIRRRIFYVAFELGVMRTHRNCPVGDDSTASIIHCIRILEKRRHDLTKDPRSRVFLGLDVAENRFQRFPPVRDCLRGEDSTKKKKQKIL